MTPARRPFRGFRFPPDVILWAVRWYLQFPISYRDLGRAGRHKYKFKLRHYRCSVPG